MNSFAKFQKKFCNSIQGDNGVGELIDHIIPVGKLSNEGVLKVYKEDFYARLTEALGSTYEVTWEVLGDEDFLRLCNQYIKKYPSSFYSLGQYGKNFKNLIEQEGVNSDIPFASELAEFEWCFWEVFHSSNPEKRPNLDFLNSLLVNNSEVSFSSEVQVFKFKNRIGYLWKERHELGTKGVDDFLSSENVVIGRSSDGVVLSILNEDEYLLLNSLRELKTWEKATDGLDFLEGWSQESWADFFQKLIQFLVIA